MERRMGLRGTICSKPAAVAVFLTILFTGCFYSPVGDWTQEDLHAAEHYYRSIRANNEFLRITKQIGPNRAFTDAETKELRKQMQIAADEARLFLSYPTTLDKMHPDLQWHFRDEYLAALDLTLQNFSFPNKNTARRSDNLYNTYIQWFLIHRDDIRLPRGV